MIGHFDAVKELADRPAELELAIYKLFSKSSELESAMWAKEFILSKGYDQMGSERVYNLIMATIHNGQVQVNDEKLIVDIDLTVLRISPEVYDEFEQNVRKEYKMVPSIMYRKKRKKLLKSFLSNASIYNLEYYKNKYEGSTMHNISKAIEML